MKKYTTSFYVLLFTVTTFSACCKKCMVEPEQNVPSPITGNYSVMSNGKIVPSTGFGMGVNDSNSLGNWVKQDSTSMVINYPGNLGWGAVFITTGGDPVSPPQSSIDISRCSKLSIEMKGAKGSEGVFIGIKDKDNPNNGTETKKALVLTNDWKIYEFQLSDFITCDLTKVYVVTEFVFPSGTNQASTIEIKNITILK